MVPLRLDLSIRGAFDLIRSDSILLHLPYPESTLSKLSSRNEPSPERALEESSRLSPSSLEAPTHSTLNPSVKESRGCIGDWESQLLGHVSPTECWFVPSFLSRSPATEVASQRLTFPFFLSLAAVAHHRQRRRLHRTRSPLGHFCCCCLCLVYSTSSSLSSLSARFPRSHLSFTLSGRVRSSCPSVSLHL